MSPRNLRESANMSLNMSNAFSQFNEVYMDTKQSVGNELSYRNGRRTTNLLLNHDYANYASAGQTGEPIAGIGIQVKKNREKMKEIFKKGRKKAGEKEKPKA